MTHFEQPGTGTQGSVQYVAAATAAAAAGSVTGTTVTGTYSGGEVLNYLAYPVNAAVDFAAQIPIHDFMRPESLSDKAALTITTVSLMGYGIDRGARYVRARFTDGDKPGS